MNLDKEDTKFKVGDIVEINVTYPNEFMNGTTCIVVETSNTENTQCMLDEYRINVIGTDELYYFENYELILTKIED